MEIGDDLLVSGWLIAAAVLEITVTGDVTLDVGALIETRDDNNTLKIDATGAMSLSGKVEAQGAGGKPELNAGRTLSLLEGGIVSAPGANALVVLQSDELVTLDEGTAVLAGVQFTTVNGSPVATVTGANSNVVLRTPHELFIPSQVAASQGITLEGGAPLFDHSDYFQSATPEGHPLHHRSQYAILVTGTLTTFGDATDLVLAAADDVIVRGNLDVRGVGSNLILQSDRSVFFEGFATIPYGNITLYGGVELDGTDRGGADATGNSVTLYEASQLNTLAAGSFIDIRGAQDVELLGAVIAGGVVGNSGINWSGSGDATITLQAGQRVFVDQGLQASKSVTVSGGTPGADDGGLSVVFSLASGLNAAGLSADASASGLVRIDAAGDLEMMGHITSGATIVETASGRNYDWTGHLASDVLITATGRAFIGGNTVNIDGDPVTTGGVIRTSRAIVIDGGSHSSGTGVEVHPNSELWTHNADSSIVITSDQDASIRGRIAAGGEISSQGVVSLFEGTATLSITAAHQVRISREVAASQTLTVTGGIDPIDASDPHSGESVGIAATGLLRTLSENGSVNVSGPQSITFFNSVDPTTYNVQAPGINSDINIVSGDRLTIGGRLQSYRSFNLNGLDPTLGDTTEGSTVELTERSLLETINGTITFNAGGTGLVRGSLTAGGAGSDIIILFSSDGLTLGGKLHANDEIVIDVPGMLDVTADVTAGRRIALSAGTTTVDGQTDLFIRQTATLTVGGDDFVPASEGDLPTITLAAQNNILIDGAILAQSGTVTTALGTEATPATVAIASQTGDVTLTAAVGRIESAATLSIDGRAVTLQGVILTTAAMAAVGADDVTFNANDVLTLTGDVDVTGSVLAQAAQALAVSRGTVRVRGDDLLRLAAPEVTIGAVGWDSVPTNPPVGTESQPTELGGVIVSGGSLEIAATDVTLRAGTQVLASGRNAVLRIDAEYLDVTGSLRAGADLNANGQMVWTGTAANVDLNVTQMLTLGGTGYDATGVLVDVGGRIQATGSIDIAVNGGTDAIGFYVANALSTVQTDATGFGALIATAPSAITIATDRDLHIAGLMLATDDGADITLTAGQLLKLDGFLQADDQLTATGGADSSGLSVHVTGTLNTGDGGHITLSGPQQILTEGVVGWALLPVDGEEEDGQEWPSYVTVTTAGAVDVRGQVAAHSLIDIDAEQLNVLNGGFLRTSHADALLDARTTGNLLIARGGQMTSSGSLHLFAQNIRVDGFVDSGIGFQPVTSPEDTTGRMPIPLLANAVQSIVVTGTLTSQGDLHLNAGAGADWTDAQLTGTITAADLTGGLVRVSGAGQLDAVGELKIAAGEDVELQADASAPGSQRAVQTPTIVFQPQTIDVIVGYREVAAGVIYTPIVTWVDTRVEVQTGVELIRNGTYFRTMDVSLNQDGYFNGTTQRETFIQGLDYANSLADVTYPITGRANVTSSPNLFADPAFATAPDPGHFRPYYGGQTIGPWTVTGTSVDLIGPCLWEPSPGGGRSIGVEGDFCPGGIKQTIATVPGQLYQIDFAVTLNAGLTPSTPRGLIVEADGRITYFVISVAAWHRHADMDWQARSLTFVATDTQSTIEFRALANASGLSAVVADLSVRAVPFVFGSADGAGRAIRDGESVTFGFDGTAVHDLSGGDFNVYEIPGGDGAEFDKVSVFVSQDGVTYFDVTATAADAVLPNGVFDPDFVRSFDIASTGLTSIKYVRLTGTGADGFDLDSVGATLVNPNNAPIIDWADDAPEAGATFNQLSQSQRELVVATLGYEPLYDFSFANAQEHRTQNGSTSVVEWTPYWAHAATHVVKMDLPGLEDRYIRLPIDAELDVARVVTQGAPTTTSEIVGSFTNTAVARYNQDRSRYQGFDDLDGSNERFAVSYAGSGRQTFTLNDGYGGTLAVDPAWATSVDTELGLDANSQLVLAPLGFLPDTTTLLNEQMVDAHYDVLVLNPAFHPMLNDVPQPKSVLELVSGNFDWTVANIHAVSRNGYLATIGSSLENFWATTVSRGGGVWIGFTDLEREGSFRWVTGEPVTFTNWRHSQPDNARGIEDYAHLNFIDSGVWNDMANPGFLSGEPEYVGHGYILERPAVEDFYDYHFDWTSQPHSVEALRLNLSFQWTSNPHDLFSEVPVFELKDASVAIVEQIASTNWVTQPITEQQTVLRPTRVLVPQPAREFSVFSGDSLKSASSIVIDATRDVSLSGLVTAKNDDGTAGSIKIDAGRDFFMTGAKADGASAESLAAVAGMTAVTSIEITTGGSFSLAESINITADDGNAATSTANKIIVTAAESAIIRGTLATTNTQRGEITVRAGDEIELKGEIVSGHIVNVFAGTDGVGGIASDIQGHIKTLGSEVHLSAGANGGSISLTDLFIETAGPMTLSAPSGSISNPGGLFAAGKLTASAQDGIDIVVAADSLDAEVTGPGNLAITGYGELSLERLVTNNGAIGVQGPSDMQIGLISAGGAEAGLAITTLGTGTPIMVGSGTETDPLYLTVTGGQTIPIDADFVFLTVTTPGDVTLQHAGTGTLTLHASVVDGSLFVTTAGDLIVPEVTLLSNHVGLGVHLVAGGDVTIGLIDAGDFLATAEEAAALRAARGMAADDRFTSLTDVRIQAGGSILEAGPDADLDIIAGALTLNAGQNVDAFELAINELTSASAGSGSISLTDQNGVGELSLGLHVVAATATLGGVTIATNGSMLVDVVTASGSGADVSLAAHGGSLQMQQREGVAPSLSSAGGISLTAASDVRLVGTVTATNAIGIEAGASVLIDDAGFSLSGNSLCIHAERSVVLNGDVAIDSVGWALLPVLAADGQECPSYSGSVTIVSHHGDIVLPANIHAPSGGSLHEIVVNANGHLNLTHGTLGPVMQRLSLTAGHELLTDLLQQSFVVTGTNGELSLSAGGDLVLLGETELRADYVSLASTGYVDEAGNTLGGNLTVIATPRNSANTDAPKILSLAAATTLNAQQTLTATESLKLAGGQVILSRSGTLRYHQDAIFVDGIAHPVLQTALAGSVGANEADAVDFGTQLLGGTMTGPGGLTLHGNGTLNLTPPTCTRARPASSAARCSSPAARLPRARSQSRTRHSAARARSTVR